MKTILSIILLFLLNFAAGSVSQESRTKRKCDRDAGTCYSQVLRDCFFKSTTTQEFMDCGCLKYKKLEEWYLVFYKNYSIFSVEDCTLDEKQEKMTFLSCESMLDT